jgi:exopolyphosphatase/guanosine-5'-triphosphate,3'-diphosphate pyrophosphatase
VNFDPKNGKFKILDRERDVVRLGSGSSDMKYLSASAAARGLAALKRFKRIASTKGAPIRAVATSAVREALNKNEFIEKVKHETGIDIEVISGFEEARLIYLGVLQALPVYKKRILLIDIGGGSTEFLIGEKRKIRYSNSLKIGAVRLTERFFSSQKYTDKSIKKCRKYIAGELAPVVRSIKKLGHAVAVGTSGTILNSAQMIRKMVGGPGDEKLNGFIFTKKDLSRLVKRIEKLGDIKEILRLPGVDPERADITVAGILILEQVFKELGISEMTVSEYALREGTVLDTLEKKHSLSSYRYLNNLKHQNVLSLARNFNYDERHARNTAFLSLRLFDQLHGVHGLEESDREYLEYAATLHDIGMFVSHSQHHRHSYYLIRNSELQGFTENEKEIMACVARYHRKSQPKPKHEGFKDLNFHDRLRVEKLAALLRIADGLDRSHSGLVKDVRCIVRDSRVTVGLVTSGSAEPEIETWGAERKKDLFEKMFSKRLVFKTTR